MLGLFTVSAGLLLAGAVLLVAALTNTAVPARASLAGALVLVGLRLVVGAWFGGSRGLIWLGASAPAATAAGPPNPPW